MLGPTKFSLNHYFYPMGNTPAVNLLQSRPLLCKTGDPLRVLLLGCGDPRNLIFTLWCNKDEQMKWEFMCCDLEIAILARNILLYSLIIDHASYASTWNIFYHFYITNTDNALLKAQLSKLMERSVSLQAWSSSVYGASISIMNQETLDQSRETWSQYLEVADLRSGSEEREKLEVEFQSEIDATMEEHHYVKNGVGEGDRKLYAHALRAAGVNWRRAIVTAIITFRRFWDYGVVGGNSQDVEGLTRDGRCVNPTMAISSAGNKFAIPHSSDPLLGFHLASAFDDDSASEQKLEENVVELAKSQFREWCMVFGEKVRSEEILVRLYCGDALRFCYELQSLRSPEKSGTNILRLYGFAWRSTPIVLDNFDVIHAFDIIDTSNLVDHLGILNLLPATSPLLSRKATSTMFTETLTKYTQDPSDTISRILCSDTTTMSLLLGLTPSGYLFGFTADASMVSDAIRQLAIYQNKCDSFHMRISWRCPNLEDPVGRVLIFQPSELAKFFFKLYLKMFDFDSTTPEIGRMVDRQKYNRLSFTALVCLAKSCIEPNAWSEFQSHLWRHIQRDSTLVRGVRQIFELSLHFYHLGISSELPDYQVSQEIILANQKDFKEGQLHSHDRGGDVRLLGQQDVPPVVWITLSVSRDRFGSFKTSSNSSTTIGLQIKIWHIGNKNETDFLSLQCFFGSLIQSPRGNYTYDVLEDKSDWKGSSNLIVTCAVPTVLLLEDSIDSTRVELAVLDTGSGVKLSGPRKGRNLAICCYNLDDKDVFILKEPPGVQMQFSTAKLTTTQQIPCVSKQYCFVRMRDDSTIATMEIRNKFEHLESERATRARQVSPCAISDRFNGIEINRFQFPYPSALHAARIDQPKKIKTLVVRPSSALDSASYSSNPFPIVLHGSDIYALNLPKVDLDRQVIISPVGTKVLAWVIDIMSTMQCARERSTATKNDLPAITRIKHRFCSMATLFLNPSEKGRYQTFLFKPDSQEHIAAIIFVAALRHNIGQSSLVFDAYVLPYKAENNLLGPVIGELLDHTSTQPITYAMNEADELLMKQMLPATVEACRKGWSHGLACEYRQYSSLSLFTELVQSPICSCGEGKDVEGFPRVEGWKILSKHATRVALMMLSSVPYVEV